jgi:hypothetical protein
VLTSGTGCSHEEYLEQSLRRTGVMPYGIMHSDQAFELNADLRNATDDGWVSVILQVPGKHLLCFRGDMWHGGRDGPPRVHAALTHDGEWDSAPNFRR